MTGSTFARMIEEVAPWTGATTALRGIHIERNGDRIRLVATNGSALVWSEATSDLAVIKPAERPNPRSTPGHHYTLSRRGLLWTATLIAHMSEPVTWDLCDSDSDEEEASKFGLMISCGGFAVNVPFLETHFPDYKQILDTKPRATMTMQRKPLRAMLKRAKNVLQDRNRLCRLSFEPEALWVTASDAVYGEAMQQIAGVRNGPPLITGVNARLFRRLLRDASDTIAINYGPKPLDPFTIAGRDDWFAVIMPCRLD